MYKRLFPLPLAGDIIDLASINSKATKQLLCTLTPEGKESTIDQEEIGRGCSLIDDSQGEFLAHQVRGWVIVQGLL